MLRRVLVAVLCLVLGFMIQSVIAVSAWLGYFSHMDETYSRYLSGRHEREMVPHGDTCALRVHGSQRVHERRFVYVSQWNRFGHGHQRIVGLRDELPPEEVRSMYEDAGSLAISAYRTSITPLGSSSAIMVTNRFWAGVPFGSLSWYVNDHLARPNDIVLSPDRSFRWEIETPEPIADGIAWLGNNTVARTSPRHTPPSRIALKGTFANTVFFAAIAWPVLLMRRVLRREVRRRRGRCLHCNYQLAGLTTCPECGSVAVKVPSTSS